MKSSVAFLAFAFLVNDIYKAEGGQYEDFWEVANDKAMERNCEFTHETLEDGQEGYKMTIKKRTLVIKMPKTLQTRKDLFKRAGLEDICEKRGKNELKDFTQEAAAESFLRTCVNEKIYESRVDMKLDYEMSEGKLTVHIEKPHYLLPKHEQFERHHKKLLMTVLTACDTFPWVADEIKKQDKEEKEEPSEIKEEPSKGRRRIYFEKLLHLFERKSHDGSQDE